MCGTRRASSASHRPAEEAEPGAAFLAVLEQELHADADAERAAAPGRGALAQRLVDAGAREPRGCARDVTDPGDDGERRLDAPRPHRSSRTARHPRARARRRGCAGSRHRSRRPRPSRPAPDAVDEKSQKSHESRHSFARLSAIRSPRVAGGLPPHPGWGSARASGRARHGSRDPRSQGALRRAGPADAVAERTLRASARPSALNAASATWWSSLAGGLDVHRAAGLDREPLERVRQQRQRQPADAVARERRGAISACGRRTRSTTAVARASSIGTVAAPYRVSPSRPRAPRAARRREPPSRPRPCGARRRRVPAGDHVQVEAAVERELRQQMVEEADAGSDPRPPPPVQRERDPQRRLRASSARRAPIARRSARRLGPERGEQPVVLGRQPRRDPDRVVRSAGRRAPALRAGRPARGRPRPARRRSSRASGGTSNPAARSASRIRSRSATSDSTSSTGSRSAAAAIRAAATADTGAGARRRSSSAATSVDATAYPTRSAAKPNAFDRLRIAIRFGSLAHERHDRAPRVLEVRLVDRDDRVRQRARERGDRLAARRSCAGRVRRVADPDDVDARERLRLERRVDDLGALDSARDRVQRVGRRLHRGRPAGRRETSARRARSGRPRRRRRRSPPGRRPHTLRLPPAARDTCPPDTRSAPRSSRRAARRGTPGSGGTFASKRSTSAADRPCAAATSAAVRAQT